MTNFKKMIMGFAAVVLIVVGSAFSTKSKTGKVGGWYQPLAASPIPMNSNDRLDQSKYDPTPLPSAPSGDCPGQDFVCAAHFDDITQAPDIIYDQDL